MVVWREAFSQKSRNLFVLWTCEQQIYYFNFICKLYTTERRLFRFYFVKPPLLTSKRLYSNSLILNIDTEMSFHDFYWKIKYSRSINQLFAAISIFNSQLLVKKSLFFFLQILMNNVKTKVSSFYLRLFISVR